MAVKRFALSLPFFAMLLLIAEIASAQCKNPVLEISYEGFGMVINGHHLYLSVCRNGEVQYDNGEFNPVIRWQRSHLTREQSDQLRAWLNDPEIKKLRGTYAGVIGTVRDHSERVDVRLYRSGGPQTFTALDFYGKTEEKYPPALVRLFCGIDSLRTKTDWHISASLQCSGN